MQIGIFGGSFNPPHKTHLCIASELIKKDYVDKIIFVPTASNYQKKDLINMNHRINMLNIAIKNKDLMKVSDISDKGYFYTYQVLKFFKKIYPNDEIYFICGADNLSYFTTWKKYKYILKNYHILVINRQIDITKLIDDFTDYKDRIIVTDIKTGDKSSTLIRNLITNHKNVSKYIEKEVHDYIKNNNLYQNKER